MTPGSDQPPLLIGRTIEVSRLASLLGDARGGRGSVVLVEGEAGIGKTRLLEAATERARALGLAVAWGRCSAGESPPYWPWRQLLRTLSGEDPRQILERPAVASRPELLGDLLEAFEVATAKSPALLVVDDLHWADESTLAALPLIVTGAPSLPIVLAMSARDEPGDRSDDFREVIAELPASVVRLPLAGLDRDGTDAMLRSVLDSEVPDELIAEVQAKTGGNPLFVGEFARLHLAQDSRSPHAVPAGVRHVLTRRLARLSQPASQALAVASVLEDVDPAAIAEVSQLTLDEVVAVLGEAIDARLVITDSDGRHDFAHALVREVVHDELGAADRVTLHRRAADVIERSNPPPSRSGAAAARIAMHLREVPGPEARGRVAAAALEAARFAAAAKGFEDAARFFRIALEHGCDDALAVRVELGEAEVLSGDLVRGRGTLYESADDALRLGEGEIAARALLAAGTGVGGFEVDVGDEWQAAQLAEAADLLLPRDSSLRAAMLARLSLASAAANGDDRRLTLAQSATDMARRLGDQRVEIAALAALCDVISGPDHLDERLACAERMVALAVEIRDPVLSLLARRHRIEALLERGEIARVDEEIAAYVRTAGHLRLPLYSWLVPIWRGMRALMDGDLDAAAVNADAAADLGAAAGSHNADVLVFTLRFAIARSQGTTAALSEDVERMTELYAGYPAMDGMLAEHLLSTGDRDGAHAVLRRRMAAGLDSVPRDSEWIEAMSSFADIACAQEDESAAALLYDALVPYADFWIVDGIGAACFGSMRQQLGRLASVLGREDAAVELLEQALDAHRTVGALGLASQSEFMLAAVDRSRRDQAGPALPELHGGFRRDGRIWHLRWRAREATVPDSKGMADLARLLEVPGREISVVDLVEVGGGPGAHEVGGDAGPLLDARARRAYERRLGEIEADLERAEAMSDLGRVDSLRTERDFLVAELSAAFGLGGRSRSAADPVERARKAVARRLGTAMRAIREVHPELARHLDNSVSTGRFCCYRPETPVTWDL